MAFVVRPWQEAKLISLMRVLRPPLWGLADSVLGRRLRERSRNGLSPNLSGRGCSPKSMELVVLIVIRSEM